MRKMYHITKARWKSGREATDEELSCYFFCEEHKRQALKQAESDFFLVEYGQEETRAECFVCVAENQ